ncbi:MAG: threonine synthase [Alcaligenaceae bacterium]|nr:threonine synthase [Alcaligenaceae bacterium]
MKYVSTRGGLSPTEFSDILLEGLAPDGGLSVPSILPRIDNATLEVWRRLSYAELATEILSLFITDIPKNDVRDLCEKTYNTANFNCEEIVPLKKINDKISLVGLSEGPTLAFKDMAMQFLGNIFEYVLAKRNTTINILGATSGDTGSAAEYALRGKKGVQVFMLSPHGRMSEFQRAQMFSLDDDNIHNITIKGVFDDCQDIVKALNNDLDFKENYHIGAVNSINFGRIAAQVVYYFWAWLRATEDDGAQRISITVPSGNFGNILAGHIARQMGLPIKRLVLATNENNVLEEFFRTGIYRPRAAEKTYKTSSPSMDISKASNFERFVYDLMHQDGAKVKALWAELESKGYFDLADEKHRFEAEFGFVSGASSHQDRLDTIKSVYEESGLIIDPHTADGVKVARENLHDGVPMLVLETALPLKFAETIQEAIGVEMPLPEHLTDLMQLPQYLVEMDNNVEQVRAYLQENIQAD